MKIIMKKYFILSIILMFTINAFAQFGKVRFNGVGRSYINTSKLSGDLLKNDSVTADRANNGVSILDLNFNIQPNKSNEIVALTRVTNKFGGFWGSGLTLDFRQLYLRGVIANVLRYRVGDIYVKNSQFTTFNPLAEESYNEAAIFGMYRNYMYYDNFHQKDRWHMQGANIDFGLQFNKVIDEILFDGYIARNNTALLLNRPETLYEGAKITINQSKAFNVSYHFANYFEMARTASLLTEYHNPVHTVDFNVNLGDDKLKYRLFGEAGVSSVKINNDKSFEGLNDNVFEVGGAVELVPAGLTVLVSYRQVGADFRSPGAQTKRLNYNVNPQVFSQVTNAQTFRPITIFDITKDESLSVCGMV